LVDCLDGHSLIADIKHDWNTAQDRSLTN